MDKDRVLAVMDQDAYEANVYRGSLLANYESRKTAKLDSVAASTAVAEVYARVERLEAENERMENLLASGVHSCSAYCERPICVMRRERDAALADLAALRARVEAAPVAEIEHCEIEGNRYQAAFDDDGNFTVGQRVKLLVESGDESAQGAGG